MRVYYRWPLSPHIWNSHHFLMWVLRKFCYRANKDKTEQTEKRKHPDVTDSSAISKQNTLGNKRVKTFCDSDPSDSISDLGTTANGIVSFDDNDKVSGPLDKSKVVKAYHSSSEDEADPTSKVSDNSKHKSSKSVKTAEDKEKLRQRFLEKQKLAGSESSLF